MGSLRVGVSRLPLLVTILLSSIQTAGAKVIKLDNKNFESKTQASRGEYSGYWVVAFCGQTDRCDKLRGTLNDLSNELKRTSKGLVFAHVNYDDPKNKELLARFQIQTSPTLIFIEQAHYARYSSRTFSKAKIKSFAQLHASGESFKQVPKPKDVIEETIGPILETVAGFVFFWPVAFLMNHGLAEMPARILWFGVLYVTGKTFEETIWNKHCNKKKGYQKLKVDRNSSRTGSRNDTPGEGSEGSSRLTKRRNKNKQW